MQVCRINYHDRSDNATLLYAVIIEGKAYLKQIKFDTLGKLAMYALEQGLELNSLGISYDIPTNSFTYSEKEKT